jgi:transitional endoplasmic reticulum ATPase
MEGLNPNILEALLGKEGIAKAVNDLVAKNKKQAETEIRHSGTEIILPAEPVPMEIKEAIALLALREAAAEQEYQCVEFIKGMPYDVAAAFYRVLKNRYGFASSVAHEVQTFFGNKKTVKPYILNVRVGPEPGEILQVPFGAYQLPGFSAPITTAFDYVGGQWGMSIKASLKAKDRDAIRAIVTAVETELRSNSIYRGKALILKTNEYGEVEGQPEPEFMSTTKIDPSRLILPATIAHLVEVALFTPVRKTEACVKHDIPLKRTVTLAGPYGTGKTLCAYATAKYCVENGWTFVMVDRPEGLKAALEFARQFEPAVVFAEDIDRVTEHRDTAANDLLNTIDGILAKDSRVMTVLTTNHIEKVQKAMLRPGRMDAIVNFVAPDAEAAQKLIRLFAGKLLKKGASLERLGEIVAGHIPATLREIVERSKLGMISRGDTAITEHDLIVAAESMKAHADLIAEHKVASVSAEEAAGRALKNLMNGHHQDIKRIDQGVDALCERLDVSR